MLTYSSRRWSMVIGAVVILGLGLPPRWLTLVAAAPVCPDGICSIGENPCNCPADCGALKSITGRRPVPIGLTTIVMG